MGCRLVAWRFNQDQRIRGAQQMNLVQALSAMSLMAVFHTNAAEPANIANSGLKPARPNIVFILVDDMGYGDPGCYNSESKILTPSIDSLARDGMRFTDAHASGPLCHLSRYGLMTGQYPFRATPNKWRQQPTIAEDRVTMPGLLKSAGYSTAMVGKWHLGFREDGYDKPLPGGPADRGFDSFFGIRASTDIPPYFYIRGNRAVSPPTSHIGANSSAGWSPIQGEFWREGGIAPDLALKDVLPRFTEEAISVLEKHSAAKTQTPLMMYLAYPAPHTPWLPSRQFAGKSQAGMYGDFMMMVDHHIGRVLQTLESTGMADDTLVIFTSDNGPVWYDKDVEKFGHDSSGGLRGMKSDAWECGHRMPFVVRWPGIVDSGTTAEQTISFVDVMATLAEVADVDLPGDAAPDSYSFRDVLIGRQLDQPTRTDLVLKSGNGFMTIRSGDWKYIDGLGSGGFSKPNRVKPGKGGPVGQLYNLKLDPDESDNVYSDHTDLAKQLQARMKRIAASNGQRLMP